MMREAVVARLAMLGYQAAETDAFTLDYLAAKWERDLLANLHRKELPEGLFYTLVDLVAGEFLQDRLSSGTLKIEGLDFSEVPKSITEGDVKVDFSGASDGARSAEAQFIAQVDQMLHPPERVLGAYRRLAW